MMVGTIYILFVIDSGEFTQNQNQNQKTWNHCIWLIFIGSRSIENLPTLESQF